MSENALYQCRLCLKYSEFCYSLIYEDVTDIIESFTSIKIEENDDIPSICCAQCLEDVYLVYKIRCRIIESDKSLREKRKLAKELSEGSPAPSYDPPDSQSDDDPTLTGEVVNPAYEPPENNIDKEIVHIEVKPDLDEITINPELNEVFKKKLELKRQMARTVVYSECPDCGKTFSSPKLYQQHSGTHRILSVCTICGIQVLTVNYRRHVELHKSTPQVCELCGAVAKNSESLRGHMFYMHKSTAEQYKCKHCAKCYRYKYKYKLHLRKAHGGERTHICEVCGKAFFTARDVNRHIQMTHMKLRPYICEYCSKGFSSSYALRTHVRQHTNEKPFKCEVCTEGFRQRVSLKTHLKSKHGIIVVQSTENGTNLEITAESSVS